MYVTAEHPFYIVGKGWVKVKDLKEGDSLHLASNQGNYGIISSIIQVRKMVSVYNIEVAGNHNYYIINNKVLVHNKNIPEDDELFQSKEPD